MFSAGAPRGSAISSQVASARRPTLLAGAATAYRAKAAPAPVLSLSLILLSRLVAPLAGDRERYTRDAGQGVMKPDLQASGEVGQGALVSARGRGSRCCRAGKGARCPAVQSRLRPADAPRQPHRECCDPPVPELDYDPEPVEPPSRAAHSSVARTRTTMSARDLRWNRRPASGMSVSRVVVGGCGGQRGGFGVVNRRG